MDLKETIDAYVKDVTFEIAKLRAEVRTLRAALKVAHTYVPPGSDRQKIVDALLGAPEQSPP